MSSCFKRTNTEAPALSRGPSVGPITSAGLISLSLLMTTAAAGAKPYKGGELYSSAQYKYGRMEMRMRMAKGSGILSTFFTYKTGSEGAGTFWEEVDIEVFGKDDARSWQSNIITGQGTRITSEEVHETATSLADGYHTYALVWTPDYVAWELDGTEVRRTTGGQVLDLDNPQSFRFNLWAANIAEWVGDFDDSALPQYQFVNWISYSRYENGQFIQEWRDDFNSLDGSRWARANWTFAENLVDFDPNNITIQDGTLVLSLTREGMTGFRGTVPFDDPNASTGGASGAGGASSGGASAGGASPVGGGPGGEAGGSSNVGGGLSVSTGGVGQGAGGQGAPGSGGSLESSGGTVGAGGGLAPASGGAPTGEPPGDAPTDSGGGCSTSPNVRWSSAGWAFAGLGLLLAGLRRSRRRQPATLGNSV